MPEGYVTISLDTARCLEKDSNLVEVSKEITASDTIKEELAKELINTTLDNKKIVV
ncbi:MAG: hypothetical protein L6V81_00915 [Clostridium sp.]|nr:MAG: hypothetical protein L6V81_00915 [Clostridium sp.]